MQNSHHIPPCYLQAMSHYLFNSAPIIHLTPVLLFSYLQHPLPLFLSLFFLSLDSFSPIRFDHLSPFEMTRSLPPAHHPATKKGEKCNRLCVHPFLLLVSPSAFFTCLPISAITQSFSSIYASLTPPPCPVCCHSTPKRQSLANKSTC